MIKFRDGHVFEGENLTVRSEPMKVVAALLRDPNPIHFDASAANASGVGPRLVNQGPLSAAYVYEALLSHFEGCSLVSASLKYLANVHAGDQVVVSAKVDRMLASGDDEDILVNVQLRFASGELAIEGRAVMRWLNTA